MPGSNRDFESPDSAGGDAQSRLALTRVLIWAEREAQDLGREDVSTRLREAISLLHAPPR